LTRALLAALLTTFLPAFLAIGQTSQPATTSAPACDLRAGYAPGQNLLLVKDIQIERTRPATGDAPPRTNRQGARLEMSVVVAASDKSGELKVRLAVRRIVGTYDRNGVIETRDTDNPDPASPPDDLLAMKRIAFDMVLNQEGKVATVIPDKEFVEKFPFGRNMTEEKKAQGIQRMSSAFGNMLTSPWSYLPARPVGVGETWNFIRTSDAVDFFAIREGDAPAAQEDMQCRLEEIQQTPAGRVAAIRLSGKAKWPKSRESLTEPTVTGLVRLNLDTRELLEHRLEFSMRDGAADVHIKVLTGIRPLATPPPQTAPSR
jgi:hypothetical protein